MPDTAPAMKYCRTCVLPSTRPNLVLDATGECNACRNHRAKLTVDWAARARAFREIVDAARRQSATYDCVIPVSGGKDSTWQVVTCLEHGMRPLAVTWRSPGRNELGDRNLRNLVGLGVDHIEVRINPEVERRFMRLTLERAGSPAIPMHLAIYNIPLTIAARFHIPLVVWGENSAVEYGGDEAKHLGADMTAEWRAVFGATQGTTAEDWLEEGLGARALAPYFGPSDAELQQKGIRAIFLGHYFRWDPEMTFRVASAHGFHQREEGPKTGYYDYADIDDDFTSVHHYLKWFKFGLTRTFDNLSIEIRNGRLTRADAIRMLSERGAERPSADVAALCAFMGMSVAEFDAIAERYRNPAVWTRRDGVWMIENFIVPSWNWSDDLVQTSL